MLAKLQRLDTNCIHIPSSTKTSTSSVVSVSKQPNKPQPIKKLPNGGVKKRLNRVYKKPHEPKTHQKHDLCSTQNGFSKYPDGENNSCSSRVEKKRGSLGGNGVAKKTHAKCSTKWLRYGGFIPAILEALETVADLDEALGPWEKRLGNKERTIVLKEQSSWERALEIFEWFKREGSLSQITRVDHHHQLHCYRNIPHKKALTVDTHACSPLSAFFLLVISRLLTACSGTPHLVRTTPSGLNV